MALVVGTLVFEPKSHEAVIEIAGQPTTDEAQLGVDVILSGCGLVHARNREWLAARWPEPVFDADVLRKRNNKLIEGAG